MNLRATAIRLIVAALALGLLLTGCARLEPPFRSEAGPVVSSRGMVVSDHPAATRTGVEILRQGGNAFDAAVAVQFALAVAYPGAGNIGGGGFALVRTAGGESAALDFREAAPRQARRDMYLDPDGDVIPRLSLDGHVAAGVPGSVDGMVRLHRRFGHLAWDRLLQPAVDLARTGFVLTPRQADRFNAHRDTLIALNDTPPPLVRSDRPWRTGDRLVQARLAQTLERIRDHGRDGFYAGETARLLVAEMQRGGGLISAADLASYRAIWRQPVTGTYRGHRVLSMPPPSSGGVALLQILYGAEAWPMAEWPPGDWRRTHVLTEIERLVYADRAYYMGDPDYVDVPVATLLGDFYLQSRFADIELDFRTPSAAVRPGVLPVLEPTETTHFSVVDAAGNAVSVTTTLNGSFGSRVMVGGAGFLLNNEMDDFSSKPGVPNQFGLVGGEANAIAPGKRMLSSMTPTIVETDGRLFLVLGSPGGSTIITTVAQVIVNMVDRNMPLAAAVAAPRTHHQWLPDVIYHEPGAMGIDSVLALGELGHELRERSPLGRVNAIRMLPDGLLVGVHDQERGDGSAGSP